MENQDEIETRFDRARGLLIYMSEEEAAAHLVDQGETPENAFLAVKAASLLEELPLSSLWW